MEDRWILYGEEKERPFVNLADLPPKTAKNNKMIAEAQRRFEVGVVYEQHGTWAVTDYGVECLVQHYPIAKDRLYESEPNHGWMFHMSEKVWVDMGDFGDALVAARERFDPDMKTLRLLHPKRVARKITPTLRFEVLKRDGYKCQLCGNGASTGSRLHIDHKQPIAKGGSSKLDNLWTLCADCNHGKGTRSL